MLRRLKASFALHTAVCASLLMVLGGANAQLPTQEPARGRKVKPTAKTTINIKKIEEREKASQERPRPKKVENENQVKIPGELRVPPGAKGKPFRAPAPEKKNPPPAPENPRTTDT